MSDPGWSYAWLEESGSVQPAAAPPRRRRWPWIVSAAALVLALVGGFGAYAAYQALNGGGTQPERVLPGDTFAFAKVDLDPAAGQKLLALRFLRHLPTVGKSLDAHNDPKQALFDALASGGNLPSDVSYDRDIKPWLGDRLAIAARKPERSGDQPDVIVAVQAKNEAKARAGIQRLTRDSTGQVGFAYRQGYAVLARTQRIADRAALDAASSTLQGSANFAADMKLLGDTGVSAGWVDLEQISSQLEGIIGPGLGMPPVIGGHGRAAYVVRFIDGGAELVTKTHGAAGLTSDSKASATFPKLGDLPASTVAGLNIQGTGSTIDTAWSAMQKQAKSMAATADLRDLVAQAKQHLGITIPADLKTLLGNDVLVAVSNDGLADQPQIGIRTSTDPAAAGKVLRALAGSEQGAGLNLQWKQLSDGIVASNVAGYADQLGAPSGPKLSDQKDFRDAVPDAAQSTLTGYVSLRAIGDTFGPKTTDATAKKWLETFRSAGFTTTSAGDVATLHLRLLLR